MSGPRKVICVKSCDNCGKPVEIRHKKRLTYKHIFCSKKCEGEYVKSHNELNATCPVCGKKFHLKPYMLKDGQVHCCSMNCNKEYRRRKMSGSGNHQYGLKGPKNATFKTGVVMASNGYRKIYAPGNPFRDSDDYVLEHRLVAEKYLLTEENSVEIDGKRYLKPEYVVHHIDGNRLNNDVSNLMVLTRSEHTKLHFKIKQEAQNK